MECGIFIGVQARGLGTAAPLNRVKPSFFGQTLTFWTEASSQKWK